MAAPSATVRQSPTGIKLKKGYRCLVTFARFPAVNLWEKTVQPGGIDGGDAIEQTTQHNNVLKTFAPAALAQLTDGQMVCAYDPAVKDTILEMANVPDVITYRYGDGTTEAKHGYLKSAEFSAQSIGEQPEVTITIVHTGEDPQGTEQEPVFVSVSGT